MLACCGYYAAGDGDVAAAAVAAAPNACAQDAGGSDVAAGDGDVAALRTSLAADTCAGRVVVVGNLQSTAAAVAPMARSVCPLTGDDDGAGAVLHSGAVMAAFQGIGTAVGQNDGDGSCRVCCCDLKRSVTCLATAVNVHPGQGDSGPRRRDLDAVLGGGVGVGVFDGQRRGGLHLEHHYVRVAAFRLIDVIHAIGAAGDGKGADGGHIGGDGDLQRIAHISRRVLDLDVNILCAVVSEIGQCYGLLGSAAGRASARCIDRRHDHIAACHSVVVCARLAAGKFHGGLSGTGAVDVACSQDGRGIGGVHIERKLP